MRMFLCTIEPLIFTGKLLLTALKSVITSPKFTNFVKLSRIPPPPWLNVVPSLKKHCQAAKTTNEQANLQPTLNKGGGGMSLTIFVTDCLQN